MSRSESSRIAATFVVRMWTEHGAGQAPQWRGQVEHVQSGEQVYFRKLDQMMEFIVAYRGDRPTENGDLRGEGQEIDPHDR